MPTYEYECTRCGHSYELFQNISDPPKKRCPKCKCKVERLIGTGAGLLFKGSGFHITDYRSESYKKAASAEKEGGASKKDSAKSGDKGADTSTSKEKSSDSSKKVKDS